MAQDSTIEGGRQLDDLLKSLAPKMEKNILRTALRAGGNILRDEARTLVPRKSGDLAKTIRVSTRIRKGQVTASVKAGNRIAYYAHMVEFGTRAHAEVSRPGHPMAVNGFFSSVVFHPGAQAKPFMRPAADNKFQEAIEAITAKIRERLTAEGLNTAPPLPPDETAGAA